MLVLTRKVDESIIIGDSIEVKVLASEGGSIKLGIEAPRTIPVHRKEVFEEIVKENRSATRTEPADLGALAAILLGKKGA